MATNSPPANTAPCAVPPTSTTTPSPPQSSSPPRTSSPSQPTANPPDPTTPSTPSPPIARSPPQNLSQPPLTSTPSPPLPQQTISHTAPPPSPSNSPPPASNSPMSSPPLPSNSPPLVSTSPTSSPPPPPLVSNPPMSWPPPSVPNSPRSSPPPVPNPQTTSHPPPPQPPPSSSPPQNSPPSSPSDPLTRSSPQPPPAASVPPRSPPPSAESSPPKNSLPAPAAGPPSNSSVPPSRTHAPPASSQPSQSSPNSSQTSPMIRLSPPPEVPVPPSDNRPGTGSNPSSPESSNSPSNNGIETAGVVAIAVATGIVAFILIGLVVWCMRRRRKDVYGFNGVYVMPSPMGSYPRSGEGRPVLDWATRMKIAEGAARGIAYLHEDCHPRIIHRDIKSSNILLDNNFEARVSDFGLAKLALDANTHVSTRIMGTFGYMAPEYASSGKLTEKSDVFSFGVVLLELLTGRKPVDVSQLVGDESLVEWARPLLSHALENHEFDGLADPRLGKNYVESEMFRMIEAAAACVRHSAAKRPGMGQVVRAFDSLATTDLTNGMRVGESKVFNSAQQSAEIRWFRRMAFGSQNYNTDFFSKGSLDS